MNNQSLETFGWVGAICILGAYALVSFGKISPNHVAFQLLNFVGAVGITLVSWKKRAYQPAVLNFIWALVALSALLQMSR